MAWTSWRTPTSRSSSTSRATQGMETTHPPLQAQEWSEQEQKEATINLMISLRGIAWKQIEGIAEKAAEIEDGFMMILSELDKTFKYDDQVEMPRAFEHFFFGLRTSSTRRTNYDQLRGRPPRSSCWSWETWHQHRRQGCWMATSTTSWTLHRAEADSPRTCISFHPGLRYGSPLLPVRPRLQRTC